MENYPLWLSRGCMPGQLMPVEDLVNVVHTILQTDCGDIDAGRGRARCAHPPVTRRRVTAARGTAG